MVNLKEVINKYCDLLYAAVAKRMPNDDKVGVLISGGVDSCLIGKLVDVWPDGKAYNVAEGIIRAGYRESGVVIKPIKPGEVYEYSISLGATSNVFKIGHRIRVEISSSNFPKWDRNLNTGHALGQDAEIQLAMQTIYHNQQFPSHIVLPVIPR